MIEEIPRRANLNAGGSKFVVPIRDILASLIRSKKSLAIAFFVPFGISLVVAIALPPLYQSEAHLLVLPDQQYANQPLSRTALPVEFDSEQISKIEVEILNSRELKRAVAVKMTPHGIDPALPEVTPDDPNYERLLSVAADALDAALSVRTQIDSSVIQVLLSNRSPKATHDILSVLLETYLASRPKIFDRDRVGFLLAKRDEAALKLKDAREEIARFRQSHDIISLKTQIALLLEEQSKLMQASVQARQIVAERAVAGAALTESVAQLPARVTLDVDRDTVSESGNSRSILLGLELRRQELLSKYSATSHFITDIDQQINALKSFEDSNQPKLSRNVTTGINPVAEQVNEDLRSFALERAGNEARDQEIGRQLDKLDQRINQLTGLRREYRELERNIELADAQYRMLLKHYEDALVAETVDGQTQANVRITELSTPDHRAGGGRRLVVGAGILVGLISAIFVALIVAAFRDIMLTPTVAARQLRLPVLATVAHKESGLP